AILLLRKGGKMLELISPRIVQVESYSPSGNSFFSTRLCCSGRSRIDEFVDHRRQLVFRRRIEIEEVGKRIAWDLISRSAGSAKEQGQRRKAQCAAGSSICQNI